MSGGSHDYSYNDIDVYKGSMEDDQLEELLDDFIDLLQTVEWYHSYDIGDKIFENKKQAFKKKWFGNPDKKLVANIQSRLEDLNNELSQYRDNGEN